MTVRFYLIWEFIDLRKKCKHENVCENYFWTKNIAKVLNFC